jgi:hypothetical protein
VTTGSAPWWTYLLPVGGMLALSAGSVLQQRWRPPEPVLVSLTLQSVTAGAVFWVLAVAQGAAGPPAAPGFWGAVAWVVVLSSLGGYVCLPHAGRHAGQHLALPDPTDHDALGRPHVRRPGDGAGSGRARCQRGGGGAVAQAIRLPRWTESSYAA